MACKTINYSYIAPVSTFINGTKFSRISQICKNKIVNFSLQSPVVGTVYPHL